MGSAEVTGDADVARMRDVLAASGVRGPYRLVVSRDMADRAAHEGWEMPPDVCMFSPSDEPNGNRAERRKTRALQRRRRK